MNSSRHVLMRALLCVCGAAAVLPAARAAEEKPPVLSTLTGILEHRNATALTVKVDGDKETRSFPFRPEEFPETALKQLVSGNRVKLMLQTENGETRVLGADTDALTNGSSGTTTGTVQAMGRSWVDVKPEKGPLERYMLPWRSGPAEDGGGPDPAIMAQLAGLSVGDTVKLDWKADHRKRIADLQRVGGASDGDRPPAPPGPQVPPDAPAKPGEWTGDLWGRETPLMYCGQILYRLRVSEKADKAVKENFSKITEQKLSGHYKVTGTLDRKEFPYWIDVETLERLGDADARPPRARHRR